MIKKYSDAIPAVIALVIALTLIVRHQAPWILIALYWSCVTLKNWRKVIEAYDGVYDDNNVPDGRRVSEDL